MKRNRFFATLVILILLASLLAGCASSRYYYLDIVNSGSSPADVKVSLADGSWTVGPNSSKTVKVEKQDDKNSSAERQFSITMDGNTTTVSGKVGYSGHMVLDVTGQSCILAADYTKQYRSKNEALPAGESDITVLKMFQGQQVFQAETWDAQTSSLDFVVNTGVGEKLPDKVEEGTDVVRLISVPCDMVEDGEALYTYLNEN